jgi:hypothetical protein
LLGWEVNTTQGIQEKKKTANESYTKQMVSAVSHNCFMMYYTYYETLMCNMFKFKHKKSSGEIGVRNISYNVNYINLCSSHDNLYLVL